MRPFNAVFSPRYEGLECPGVKWNLYGAQERFGPDALPDPSMTHMDASGTSRFTAWKSSTL